ncbi:MAG TPA: transcriptional regulator [Terriglobales bacterium]|nr:transcriptional regulator [Terriglobales bacterium]
MSESLDTGVLSVDRVIHEPARLLILTILSRVAGAEFKFLETATGLSKGNLSSHLSKLEDTGYVNQAKSFRGKIPLTTVSITREGSEKLKKYQKQMQLIIKRGLRQELA